MNKILKTTLSSLLAVALVLSCVIIPGTFVFAQADSIEASFAANKGLSVGETLINENYSSMANHTAIPEWVVTSGGTDDVTDGSNGAAFGFKMRKNNNKRFYTRALPEGNFVAKFTAYSTYGNASYVDNYIGIANSATADASNSTYVRIYKNYITDNKTRNYSDDVSLGYSVLSDKYDLDDLTKGYTFYIFAIDGTYYFVDLDGNTLFTDSDPASHFFIGVSYSEMTMTEFTVKRLTSGGEGGDEPEEPGDSDDPIYSYIDDMVINNFAYKNDLAVGQIHVNEEYSSMAKGTAIPEWVVTTGGTDDVTDGANGAAFGFKMRKNNGLRLYTRAFPEGDFAAKFTAYSTYGNPSYVDNYIGITNSATSDRASATYLRIYKDYIADNKTRNFSNDTSLGYSVLSDKYDLDDLTKGYTFYIFSIDGTYYFVDLDGNTLFTYNGDASYFFIGVSYSEMTMTEFSVYQLVEASNDGPDVRIIYDANGGLFSNRETSIAVTETISENFTAEIPTREGHTFLGWSLTADGEVLTDTTVTGGLKGATLYAVWEVAYPENQDGYCGFDVYKEQFEGYSMDSSAASISTSISYTGSKSMKVSADTAFEIRNENAIDIYKGKTYKVSFFYKSDSSLSVGIGVGKANNVPQSAVASSPVSLVAASDWTKATIYVTAPEGVAEGYVLALVADVNAVAYFDNISVSSATSSVGAEKEGKNFRFMFTYDADASNQDTIIIDDERFTVVERGILVKHADNSADLIKENYGKNGVVGTVRTEMDDCFTNNSVTGSVVFSVLVEGAAISDKLSARGYVILNDDTVYYSDVITTAYSDIADSIKTVPATINEEKAYVYLPEGTVLSNGVPSATFNNEFFIEETGVVSNGVMQKGAYVSFAQDASFNDITVPAELYYTVEVGTKKQLYYGPDVTLVRKQLDSVSDDTVNYIFITDIHYKNYGTSSVPKEEHDGPMDRQLERIVKLANDNDAIDFVVVGGDSTTGMYSTAESAMDATEAALSPFKNCTKPVLVLMGNHDDNSYGNIRTSSDETLISSLVSDKYWNDRILDVYSPNVVHNTKYANSKYYYYDLANKKTRVICLDSSDYEAEYDADGVVTGLKLLDESRTQVALKYRTGYSFYGFSERQLKWLAEEALTADDGWNYIFVSHMEMDGRTDNKTPVLGSEMKNVMAAYQNKTSYTFTGDEVTINVSFTKEGRIMSYQHGHVHLENITYRDDLDIFVFASDTANLTQTDNVEIERIYMTNTEASFNVMSVSDESVYKMNVGAGKTVECYYPN